MYKHELDNHIRSGKVSNSFVLFGESSFLIDTYTKMLTNIEDSSTLNFYYDEYDFTSAKGAFQEKYKINKMGVEFISEKQDNFRHPANRVQQPKEDQIVDYVQKEN